jgi:hypothetical protein
MLMKANLNIKQHVKTPSLSALYAALFTLLSAASKHPKGL